MTGCLHLCPALWLCKHTQQYQPVADAHLLGLVGVAHRVGEAALVGAVDLVGQDVEQNLRTAPDVKESPER